MRCRNTDIGDDAGCSSSAIAELWRAYTCSMVRPASTCAVSPEHMGLSSETSAELAGMPYSFRLARRDCQVAPGVATSCLISGDRLSHSAFPLGVMVDAVQGWWM